MGIVQDRADERHLINKDRGQLAPGEDTEGLVNTAHTGKAPTFEASDVIVVSGSTDALPFVGDVFVQTAGVDAMTLATPTVGIDDGKVLRVTDDVGHAHTITTAANKIIPSHMTLTFNGTRGSYAVLKSFNGLLYPIGLSGVTAS
jgi:hypothetical protein